MISFKKVILFVSLWACFLDSDLLAQRSTDFEINYWGFFKPEQFFYDQFTFLNKNVPQDKVFYFRHTNDFFLDILYGKETYGFPVVEFKTSIRNRAVWGSPSSIANTLPTEAPFLNTKMKEHFHAFPRLFFWMREGWLKFDWAALLNLDCDTMHSFTLGAFPFELGRGIALGSAYAVGAGPLGFYSDAMVDQFAFGLKLSGELICDTLTYDIYGSILQSRSSTIKDTLAPVYKNEIGRVNPLRGFGQDNYLIAARLIWTAIDHPKYGFISFEPYGLYNNDPEQQIEFKADSSSKLGTFGLAGEYVNGDFEFGFDFAKNVGRQFVRPWDRNQIVVENVNGQAVIVNNNVIIVSDNAFNGQKAPFVPKSDAQTAIDTAAKTGSVSKNGQLIPGAQDLASLGYVPGPLSLMNSGIRFRTNEKNIELSEGYKNTYGGWMIVGDTSYWVYPNELQIAATAGYASGDQDPNHDLKDRTFNGFIGLQEVYAGKRVKSVFLLGTVGKVRRPGTEPERPLANKDFASGFNGYSNLAYIGSGLTWKPQSCKSTRLVINPNFFAYWEPRPGNKFDVLKGTNIPDNPASKFMGIEWNTFISYYPFSSLKCFAIGSVFLPGQHFTDLKGKPGTTDEKKLLEIWQKTQDLKKIPNLGDDIAYTINFGLEFAF